MKKNIVLSSITTIALLTLVGCGGGGGNPQNPVAKSAKISGVADDDLILNGIVTAKTPSGSLLAEGRTSSTDGTYELNVAHTGVVLVNVTCEEGNSTMLNPATGATQACGSDVRLNSLADVHAGVNQTVNISPLTEIVYQRAQAQAGDISSVTAVQFNDARNEIGVLFGVDPIADNPTSGTSAQIIGAIHTLADEDSATSVMDITHALAQQLADGSADGSADATVSALTTVMTDANITNNLTDHNGVYTPPENPASISDVDAAKTLFTELRTQAMSVVDYDKKGTPGFLDNEAQSMDAALNNVTMNIEYLSDVWNKIADGIGDLHDTQQTHLVNHPMGPDREFTFDKTGTGTWEYTIVEGSTTWSGTVTFPEVLIGDSAEAELYTAGTLTMTVNGTVPLDYHANTEAGIDDKQSFEGTVTVTKKTTGADISLAGKIASNRTSIELKEVTAELAYAEGQADTSGNTEPVFNYFKLNKVVLQGIVGGYTVDGSIIVNGYTQNTKLAAKGGINEVAESSFGVALKCEDNSAIIGTNGSEPIVTFTYNGMQYQSADHYSNYYYNGVPIGITYSFYDLPLDAHTVDILANIHHDAQCQNGGNIVVNQGWSWSGSTKEISNSGWLPSDITFIGAISRTGASMEGTLNAKWLNVATMDLESSDEPLVKVAFNGKLQMPSRPEMLTTLIFENDASHNTIGASYTYGSTVINMSALFDSEMDNGDVEITTHTGLKADIKVQGNTTISGTVTKDGSLVGTFEERSDVPVIKYVDGSFESLP